jgi:hypothetical protein
MSPKFVLTSDEKKIRFRNFLKKKGDQVYVSILNLIYSGQFHQTFMPNTLRPQKIESKL